MSRIEIQQTTQDIFRDILEQHDLLLTDSMTAAEVEAWDSFAHISIITSIEAHYKIRFALGEIDELKNVGDLITSIERKISGT